MKSYLFELKSAIFTVIKFYLIIRILQSSFIIDSESYKYKGKFNISSQNFKMDNFNIYLSKNISDSPNYQEANYKTTLAAKNVNLNDYEVALSSISFQNTLDLDLGSVTLISGIAKDVISTFDHKIKTKYGTDFIELFKDIEREIVKGYSKLEFKRRVLLRQSGVIDRGEYIYLERTIKVSKSQSFYRLKIKTLLTFWSRNKF